MQTVIGYARAEGPQTVEGPVLQENTLMLAMCRELGFRIEPDSHDTKISVVRLVVGQQDRLNA